MKLLKLTLSLLMLSLYAISGYSQNTAISDVVYTPNASSVLDVYSTSKGMLIPRVTLVQRNAIASPATGLLVFQTNSTPGFYYYDGTAWVPFMSGTPSTVAWVPGGNPVAAVQTLGTTSNYDLPVITNNTEKMRITTSGSVGIGSTSFSATNPERLLVDYGNTTSSTVAKFKGYIDSYLELNLQNMSDGVNASTDFIATADNGTDSTNYVDLGINSSNYLPGVENFGGNNDAYLFANARHLLVGTATNADLILMVNGGSINNNTAMRVDGATRNIIIGRREGGNASGNTVRGPNAGGTNVAGGDLTIKGGSGTGTAVGGALYLTGGSTGTGTYGAVSINASTNCATNIGTGTTTSNVSIGGSSNNVLFPKLTSVGAVHYNATAGGQLAATSLLTWDNTNTRLGINTATPTAGIDVNTNFKLGASGSVITNIIKTNVSITNTTTFNYTQQRIITVTVTGASVNASVIVNPRTTLAIGIGIGQAYVSAANTVTIVFTNTDATARAVGTGVVCDITVIN